MTVSFNKLRKQEIKNAADDDDDHHYHLVLVLDAGMSFKVGYQQPCSVHLQK